MDLGLAERVFILTGAARGLGRAAADVLVDEGARVLISGRDQAALEDATGALGRWDTGRAVGVVADNGDPGTPQRLIEAAREHFGRIDGALISVGGPSPGSVMETSDEEWTEAYHTVFLGALRLAREIAAVLGEGGSIAFVLSTSVKAPLVGLGTSNGLRPGLAMAAKTMADELGPRGIRVNGLMPGRVDTDRVRELDAGAEDPEAFRREQEQRIPLRRYGRPEEFGRAAAFLLSPAASFLTGTMLPVDGGMTRAL